MELGGKTGQSFVEQQIPRLIKRWLLRIGELLRLQLLAILNLTIVFPHLEGSVFHRRLSSISARALMKMPPTTERAWKPICFPLTVS